MPAFFTPYGRLPLPFGVRQPADPYQELLERMRQDGVGLDDPWLTGGNEEPELPAPEPVRPPAGMLERMADRMSDLGYGGGEEARRNALRRALGSFGSRLTAGALKEGLGALGPAVSEGFNAYEGGLAEQRQVRDHEAQVQRQAEQARRQGEYTEALTEQARASVGNRELQVLQAQEKVKERAALVAQRREALAQLDPQQRQRLEPLLGSDDFDKYYFEATGTPPPPKAERVSLSPGEDVYERLPDGSYKRVLSRAPLPKEPRAGGGGDNAPTTRDFPDGTERQWNPATRSWDVVARKPAPNPADVAKERAQELYAEALKNSDSALRVKNADGTLDVRKTWARALEAANAAGSAAPPAADRTLVLETAEIADVRDMLKEVPEAEAIRILRRAGHTPAGAVALIAAARKRGR